jgi:hypothetical protein
MNAVLRTSTPTTSPTHTLYNTQKSKLSTDELFELGELESMYKKWGCEPHGHKEDINEVYGTSGLMYNNTSTISYPPDYPDPTLNLLPSL